MASPPASSPPAWPAPGSDPEGEGCGLSQPIIRHRIHVHAYMYSVTTCNAHIHVHVHVPVECLQFG